MSKARELSKLPNYVLSTVAELKLAVGKEQGDKAFVGGYYADGDGGGGDFYWDAVSVEADNGGTIFQVTGTTTGRWKRIYSGAVNVKWFGASGDGVTDDRMAIQNASNFSTLIKKTLSFCHSKTYKILGTSNLSFDYSVDFNNAILDISTYQATIVFGSNTAWVEDTVALSALQTSGASFDTVSGWNTVPSISEHFVKITTNQYFHQYRGSSVYRNELNLVSRFGSLVSTLKYPIVGSNVTGLLKLPMNKYKTAYSNLVLNLGSRDISSTYVQILNGSNISVENIGFIRGSAYVGAVSNPTLIAVSNSCLVSINGLYGTSPEVTMATTRYAYVLSLSNCYDVVVENATAQGTGWGAVGSNTSQKVVFRDSDLSRIDFHLPFMEYLKIQDCRIGSWGVLVTALGDLIIENTTFTVNNSLHNTNTGIIRSREDTGGFCDGDLILRNIKINNNKTGTLGIVCQGSASEAPTATTPINYTFWNNITVDNVTINSSSTINIFPIVYPTFVKSPYNIIYKNIVGNTTLECGNGDARLPYFSHGALTTNNISGTPNMLISLSDIIGLKQISLVKKDTDVFFFSINAERVRGLEAMGTNFESVSRSIFKIVNSTIEGLDFYSGAITSLPVIMKIARCNFVFTATFNTPMVNSSTNKVFLDIQDSTINVTSSTHLLNDYGFTSSYLNNNYISINGTLETQGLLISSTASYTMPIRFNLENRLAISTGYDGDNTSKYIPVPKGTLSSKPRNYKVFTGETTDANIQVITNTTGTITTTPLVFRELYLMV
jgi:hypothetical protein